MFGGRLDLDNPTVDRIINVAVDRLQELLGLKPTVRFYCKRWHEVPAEGGPCEICRAAEVAAEEFRADPYAYRLTPRPYADCDQRVLEGEVGWWEDLDLGMGAEWLRRDHEERVRRGRA
ncbi:hypothetical protein SEA_UPYO_45 [Gordonia phage Upyo]|nr:hypothetical protein SEA_UPYO_45 [Gordonia phage Upyo]